MIDRDLLLTQPTGESADTALLEPKRKTAAPLSNAEKTLETVPLKLGDWRRESRSVAAIRSVFV